MITDEYITSFRKTNTFEIISNGILKGDIENVLLGKSPYRITSKFEIENTIPSQVLICLHILVKESKLPPDEINKVLKKIPITSEYVCLILGYIEAYVIYRKKHNELKLDYQYLINKLKKINQVYLTLPCYRSLMTSIENNLSS